MAENPGGNDQQNIDNAINELAERKNDNCNDRPSTSTPTSTAHKRPSPNSSDSERSNKRRNSAQNSSTNDSNKETPARDSTTDQDEHDGSLLSIVNANANANANDEHSYVAIKKGKTDCGGPNAKAGECSRAIESTSKSSTKGSEPTKSKRDKNQMKPNSEYLRDSFTEDLRSEWIAADNVDHSKSGKSNVEFMLQSYNSDVKLYSKPFKICLMQKFLNDKTQIQKMVQEMCQMEWQRKQMDLYEFHQTTDLTNISSLTKPALKKFYNMMSTDILPWMKQITGLDLTHISASCSMYNYGDYLLVHDDLLSDRQIAFVYYLSPWYEDWSDEMGGALELFECDETTDQPKYPVVEKFPPRNDQFVFFRVCKQSFHQVGEVTNLVYPRLTINGWFHGPSPDSSDVADDISMVDNEDGNNLDINDIQMHSPTDDELILSEWIDSTYLKRRTRTCIQQHIEDKSEASLEAFLIQDFFNLLLTEFRESDDLNWVLEGPANQQKYETLRFTVHSTGPPKDLYTLFTSKSMFNLLHEYTELDFDGPNAKTPTCSVQICRFTQGSYTLLGSSATYSDCALEAILFFGAKDGVGKITYLSPTEDAIEYDTTVDTDATCSSLDVNSSLGNNSSTLNQARSLKSNSESMKVVMEEDGARAKLIGTKTSNRKSTTTASTSKVVDTSLDTSIDESLTNNDPQDAEVNEILRKKSSYIAKRKAPQPMQSHSNDDSDETGSEIDMADVYMSAEEDEEDDDEDNDTVGNNEYDELAHEESLLTIHPKNNSLNLVYRLSGQTKFIKYISKNALKADEYIYILLATYKE